MPYFIIDHATPDKPEVFRIAEALKSEPNFALGSIIRAWRWADQNADAEGLIKGATGAQVDSVSGAQGLAEAMVIVGWLQISNEGVSFPRWCEYFSASAKSRAKDAMRKRMSRKSGHGVRKSRTPNTGTSTGIKKGGPGGKNDELALPFASDTFKAAFQDWVTHRTEGSGKLTPTAIQRQLARLSKMTEAEAIAAIEYSVAQGWKGIFEENTKHGANAKTGRTDQPGRPRGNADRYRMLEP